jgi:hypothetical protein
MDWLEYTGDADVFEIDTDWAIDLLKQVHGGGPEADTIAFWEQQFTDPDAGIGSP